MFEAARNSIFRRSLSGLDIRNPDGLQITLRGLSPRDVQQHQDHLQRLTPEDRRLRFHSAMSDGAIIDYAHRLDWSHAYIFGIFVDGILRGVGELVRIDDTNEGELSVSVEKEFQKAGLGRILTRALVVAGRKLGLKRIRMLYVRENTRMKALANNLGATSQYAHDVMEGVVSIDADADAGDQPLRAG
ncbi:GNAT family N-acetyltransferase [Paracoccus sp. DMF-8]|uniref:GNAT family N-acetyltransferase n=1 Tax=Paracoccus sp. DMF-8 TaxID=3019445 RepID=UPI0023E7CE6C|nr:GNAT family N-acetyltransferase [Paracoccus sp. DMF-8]MDF3606781.1 GNAT family N-acetyltransferase [Paracoccus sp. DMF-8]